MTGGGLAPDVPTLLRAHGVDGKETAVAHNGFSGARISTIDSGAQRLWLKRLRFADDWIMRGLEDHTGREAEFAASPVIAMLPESVRVPYLGGARDDDGWAILSRDLSAWMLPENGKEPEETWDAILGALADMHASFWERTLDGAGIGWCPWRPRIMLLSPARAAGLAEQGVDFGAPAGWRAFERVASPAVRELFGALFEDPSPLLRAMEKLPATLLHGDAKIANMALERARLWLFDWADVSVGPVGLELGYVLGLNSSRIPWKHAETLERYSARLERLLGDAASTILWPQQVAIAVLTGFMTLGWAKAPEAERGDRDEFEWWCEQALDAANLLAL